MSYDRLTNTLELLRKAEIDLIEKFIEDLKNKQYFWKVYRNQIIEKWEGELKK